MSPLTILTRPHPIVWQISLHNPPDNRLTPELLASLLVNLDTVEAEWRRSGGALDLDPKKRGKHGGAGALVLTSGIGKFFSNGLDYARSVKQPNFFPDTFDPVMYRLLTFPIITIAAINGHAFAGGMALALTCDFRIITSGKGLVCMNEVTFGAPLPNSFNALLTMRLPNPAHLRDTLLARRWTQKELQSIGLVDEIVDDVGKEGALVARAVEMGIEKGPVIGPGSWGLIKDGVYKHILEASTAGRFRVSPQQDAEKFWTRVGMEKAKL